MDEASKTVMSFHSLKRKKTDMLFGQQLDLVARGCA
jgi:hypothetical protein